MANPNSMPDLLSPQFQRSLPTGPPMGMSPVGPYGQVRPPGVFPQMPMPNVYSQPPGFGRGFPGLPVVRPTGPIGHPVGAFQQQGMKRPPGPGYFPQPPAKKPKQKRSDESDSEDSNDDIDESKMESQDQKERKDMLIKQMTVAQLNRHEAFARSTYYKSQKNNIKKVMATVSGYKINQNSVVVMCGIAKVFVGEMTETARVVMQDWGDTGAIKPVHLREAYRRLKEQGKLCQGTKNKPRLFKR